MVQFRPFRCKLRNALQHTHLQSAVREGYAEKYAFEFAVCLLVFLRLADAFLQFLALYLGVRRTPPLYFAWQNTPQCCGARQRSFKIFLIMKAETPCKAMGYGKRRGIMLFCHIILANEID